MDGAAVLPAMALAQLVERRTVEANNLSSLGHWFESGSRDFFSYFFFPPYASGVLSKLTISGRQQSFIHHHVSDGDIRYNFRSIRACSISKLRKWIGC